MRKLILGAVISAVCSLSATSWAAPNISSEALEQVENFPTQFSDQKACIAGVHYMRSAFSNVFMLSQQGYKTMGVEGNERRYLQELLLDEMPAIFMKYGVSNRKLGIDTLSYKTYMLTVLNMQYNPQYSAKGYEVFFAEQMQKCYTHFNEFTEDDGWEFDIIDSMGLPQDMGWDSFETISDYSSEQGKPFKLDFDGNRIN